MIFLRMRPIPYAISRLVLTTPRRHVHHDAAFKTRHPAPRIGRQKGGGEGRMREIELGGSGMVTLVDDEDYEKVIAAGPWFLEVRPRGFYALRSYGKDPRRMHRVICPEIDRIDHIDRNGLNNQKSN